MKYLLSITGFFLITAWGFLSCDSPCSPDCFKKPGTLTSVHLKPDPYRDIVVNDEIDIYLINGSKNEVEIRAGKNLIPEIHCDVSGDVMTISNRNGCNWVREPGNPGIYITNPDLYKIEIYDYVNIFTPDTLRLEHLQIFSNGPGRANLLLDVDTLIFETIFVTNFDVAGKARSFRIYTINDSRIKAKNLICDRISFEHYGSNILELYPLKVLKGKMTSSGNLVYFHEPEILEVSISGTGKLIDNSQ